MKHFHFPVTTEVPANFDQEARSMVTSILYSGIIDEVTASTRWCACHFFVEKSGKEGKLQLFTDFHQ